MILALAMAFVVHMVVGCAFANLPRGGKSFEFRVLS
jgi:hypothetical protein